MIGYVFLNFIAIVEFDHLILEIVNLSCFVVYAVNFIQRLLLDVLHQAL